MTTGIFVLCFTYSTCRKKQLEMSTRIYRILLDLAMVKRKNSSNNLMIHVQIMMMDG